MENSKQHLRRARVDWKLDVVARPRHAPPRSARLHVVERKHCSRRSIDAHPESRVARADVLRPDVAAQVQLAPGGPSDREHLRRDRELARALRVWNGVYPTGPKTERARKRRH